jgi:hypothetical protein
MKTNCSVIFNVECGECGEIKDCMIVDGLRVCLDCGWSCKECNSSNAVEFGYGLCLDCCRLLKY